MVTTPAQQRAAHLRKRQQAVEYLGGKCVKCEETNFSKLQFDHINPDTKLFPIGPNVRKAWYKLQPELDKCQLLCEKCHRKKTWRGQVHGTSTSYTSYGCRCQACYEAQSEYMQDYNERKRAGEIMKTGHEWKETGYA